MIGDFCQAEMIISHRVGSDSTCNSSQHISLVLITDYIVNTEALLIQAPAIYSTHTRPHTS